MSIYSKNYFKDFFFKFMIYCSLIDCIFSLQYRPNSDIWGIICKVHFNFFEELF